MYSVLIVGEAQDALLLAAEHEVGNVTHTLDYIPGASIRGAFAAQWKGTKGDDCFLELFESGRAIFENLRPAKGNAEGFPIPLSTRTCKTNGGWERHGVEDYLLKGMGDVCHHKSDCTAQLASCAGWYAGDMGDAKPVVVERRVTMHNQISDNEGTTEPGVLFATHEIEPGTKFCGYVRLLDDEVKKIFESHCKPVSALRVGRDSGRVKVTIGGAQVMKEPYAGKGAFDARFPKKDPVPEFTLTLMSDAILRDEHGRFHRTLDLEYLKTELECQELRVVEQGDLPSCYARSRSVTSWRGTHHLFAPKVMAVVQGSAVRLEYTGKSPEELTALRDSLERLEQRGLGEQRAQGFGRVLVNDRWHSVTYRRDYTPPKKEETATPTVQAQPPAPSAASVVQPVKATVPVPAPVAEPPKPTPENHGLAFIREHIAEVLAQITAPPEACVDVVVGALAQASERKPLQSLPKRFSLAFDDYDKWHQDQVGKGVESCWVKWEYEGTTALQAVEALVGTLRTPESLRGLLPGVPNGAEAAAALPDDSAELVACRAAIEHVVVQALRTMERKR